MEGGKLLNFASWLPEVSLLVLFGLWACISASLLVKDSGGLLPGFLSSVYVAAWLSDVCFPEQDESEFSRALIDCDLT